MATKHLTADDALAEVRRLERAIEGRDWPPRGGVAQSFTEPLRGIAAYVQQQKETETTRMDRQTLKDGVKIMRAIEDAGLDGEIGQVKAAPGTYAVDLVKPLGEGETGSPAQMGTIRGDVPQLLSLLSVLGRANARGIVVTQANAEV